MVVEILKYILPVGHQLPSQAFAYLLTPQLRPSLGSLDFPQLQKGKGKAWPSMGHPELQEACWGLCDALITYLECNP